MAMQVNASKDKIDWMQDAVIRIVASQKLDQNIWMKCIAESTISFLFVPMELSESSRRHSDNVPEHHLHIMEYTFDTCHLEILMYSPPRLMSLCVFVMMFFGVTRAVTFNFWFWFHLIQCVIGFWGNHLLIHTASSSYFRCGICGSVAEPTLRIEPINFSPYSWYMSS